MILFCAHENLLLTNNLLLVHSVHSPWTVDTLNTEGKMKSQDIMILLKLISLRAQDVEALGSAASERYSVRALGDALGISKSEINNSLQRSYASGIAINDRNDGHAIANAKAVFEFIVYGLKYVFPVKPGALARGIATSFAAPVLQGKLMSAGETDFVWPYAKGKDKGQSIEPLFKSVPEAALKDSFLYECMALVDAIRIGNAREAKVAIGELEERLLHHG